MKYKKGDYVVATKWSDGDPNDHWCVGLYNRAMDEYKYVRHDIVDLDGKSFRGNGFRRVRKIRQDVGEKLLANANQICLSYKSVWAWVRYFERRQDEINPIGR